MNRPSGDILSRFDKFRIFYYAAGPQATRAFYGKISFPELRLQNLKKPPSEIDLFGITPLAGANPGRESIP